MVTAIFHMSESGVWMVDVNMVTAIFHMPESGV